MTGMLVRWIGAQLCPVALASLALIGYTFLNMVQALAAMESKLADNPFRGLASAQMQWGWALLAIGSLLLIAAAVLRPSTHPTSGISLNAHDTSLSEGGNQ